MLCKITTLILVSLALVVLRYVVKLAMWVGREFVDVMHEYDKPE